MMTTDNGCSSCNTQ